MNKYYQMPTRRHQPPLPHGPADKPAPRIDNPQSRERPHLRKQPGKDPAAALGK